MSHKILANGLLALAACFLAAGASHAQSKKPDYTVIPKMEEVKDHPAAPDFTLSSPDGNLVSLKDYRGKVVFLNFWATWCPSCRTDMPVMDKLYRESKGTELEIVAANERD